MTYHTKRMHVYQQTLENFDVPNPKQTIVQILGTPGSNLHRVVSPTGEKYLARLLKKFRKAVWIKRGDYVIVEAIEKGGKVKAKIVRILYPQHIKAIKKENMWPAQFQSRTKRSIVHDIIESCDTLGSNDKYRLYETTRDTDQFDAALNETDEEVESIDDDDDDEFYGIPFNMNRHVEMYMSDSEDEC